MTNDFLDLARLESGRTRLSREFYNILDVIQKSVQTVKPQAAEREVQIATESDPGQLPQLVGDAEKITQVVMNLLTNAIKYNREQGSVTVRAELLDDSVQVSVSDTGVGISEASLPHIFEKFYRVADTEGYTHGTGLGLTIAKSIVEAHGGDMSVESVEGQGTTFTFVLPLPPG
jgi:two-component system sensor histidine kinase ResE